MNNPMQMQMQMQMQDANADGNGSGPAKPPKPPRRTSPAAGDVVRLEIHREGNTIRYQVLDGKIGQARDISARSKSNRWTSPR